MKPLPYRIRAQLFLQLSRLEASGLPYQKAMAMMALPSPAASRLRVMQGLAARGLDAAKAGEQSGLFSKLESRLIRAALNAGSPGPTYARLAEHYAQRHRQWLAIRSRLMLPAFVLFIALVVQPLPALVSGTLGVAGYAWQALSPLLLIAALASVLAWLGRTFPKQVPLYGPIYVRSNLRDFFESLGLMHEAGVPLLEALPAAIDTVSDGEIRRELTRARQRMEQGTPFATALEGVSSLRGSPVLAFAHTGQESGTLPEMLMRHAAIETDAIGRFYEQVAVWLPRLVYVLVAIKVVAGILSTGIGPRVPTDL
jgi:type II secretory pathway component PulF